VRPDHVTGQEVKHEEVEMQGGWRRKRKWVRRKRRLTACREQAFSQDGTKDSINKSARRAQTLLPERP
jgi:hypothetical protein